MYGIQCAVLRLVMTDGIRLVRFFIVGEFSRRKSDEKNLFRFLHQQQQLIWIGNLDAYCHTSSLQRKREERWRGRGGWAQCTSICTTNVIKIIHKKSSVKCFVGRRKMCVYRRCWWYIGIYSITMARYKRGEITGHNRRHETNISRCLFNQH